MRTEVKIGILVCLALACLIGGYWVVWGGPEEQDSSATDTPSSPPPRQVTPTPIPVGLPPVGRTPPPTTRPASPTPTSHPAAEVPGAVAAAPPPVRMVGDKPSTERVTLVARAPRAVPSPPAKPVVQPARPRIYVVQEADTKGYWGIAKKVYGAGKYYYLIAKANQVRSEHLRVGQKLVIPPLPTAAPAAGLAGRRATPVTPLPGGARPYVVKSGDSLWRIAEKMYGNGKYGPLIAKANLGAALDPLKVGQTLTIPKLPISGGGAGATTAPPVLRSGQKFYTIVTGDSLWGIAAREYGDGGLYPVIQKANRGLSSKLPVGRKIVIPAKRKAEGLVRSGRIAATSRPAGASITRDPHKPWFGD